MLQPVLPELVQNMEICSCLFHRHSAAFTISLQHMQCPAGEQVHIHRETLHRELCPLERGSLSRLVSGLGISCMEA